MKNNLVFDLDGTLWNTENSYFYALNEYMKHHEEMINRMNPEAVKSFKAITMDKMMMMLFPKESKEFQMNAILECLKYSCEYLEKQAINEEVIKTIEKLSIDNDLYIVSNCPFEYINIFLKKSNLNTKFKDIIALGGFTKCNDFDKGDNIKKIIEKHCLVDPYFIGDNKLDLESANYANVKFIHLSSDITNNDFITNLRIYDLNELLDIPKVIEENNIKNRILSLTNEYKEFSSFDARVIYINNQNQSEYKHLFGFVKYSKNKENNEIVFNQLEQYIKEKQIKTIVGPVNYNTWFDYRMPISEFDQHFIPDIKGKKEDVEFLLSRGYNYLYTYASTLAKFNNHLFNITNKIELGSEYQIDLITGNDVFNYAKDIFEISSIAFKNAYLYSDISFSDCENIYMTWLKKLPFPIDLMLIKTTNNQIIAFGLCYPDFINQLYVCKTAAILPNYRSSNVVLLLANYVYKRTLHHHLDNILFHYQNEQKNTLSKFWRGYEILKKRYAVLSKDFTYEKE